MATEERSLPKAEVTSMNLGIAWQKVVDFYSLNFAKKTDQILPYNYRFLMKRFEQVSGDTVFRGYISLAYQQRVWSMDPETKPQAELLARELMETELPEEFDFDLVRDTLAFLVPSE